MRKIEKVAKKRKIPLKDALEKRLNLLKESKREKWNEELLREESGGRCPFCYECRYNPLNFFDCDNCLCPPEICENNGNSGYIVKTISRYKIFKLPWKSKYNVINLPWKRRLNKMIKLFDKWIKETEKEIEDENRKRDKNEN